MDTTSIATMDAHAENGCGCGCGGSACACMPAEFTRLRYAYGLRLGAVELNDEQSYLVGKHRFHNARCHGAGVLCGLLVDRFVWPQGSAPQTPSTVLRVSRGAALDQCGREIVVSCDQCIDVAAWFAKNRAKLDLSSLVNNTLPLHVALRYLECPSDPAPVPREPCGCDTGGCAYTRVREGFELALFAAKPPSCAGDVFPAADALLAALNGENTTSISPTSGSNSSAAPAGNASGASADFLTVLDQLTAQSCPEARRDQWICLADFNATLAPQNPGTTLMVSDISAPDNTIPGRRPILSTSALQALLLGLVRAAGAGGLLGAGPAIREMEFEGSSATAGTLSIPVELITDANQAAPTPLNAATFHAGYLTVHQWSPGGDWNNVTPTASGSVQYDDSLQQFTVAWGAGDPQLAAGNYRLALISPDETPVADQRMRSLRPSRLIRNFGLTVSNGTLTLAPVSF